LVRGRWRRRGGAAAGRDGAQQVGEVCLQIGKVGDVGAEVAAADAAEPDRAVLSAGGDVGWLGADAVGDGDFADRASGVLGIEQGLGLASDSVAVPVELHLGDPVNGLASPFLGD
jgi:hypothetical protein